MKSVLRNALTILFSACTNGTFGDTCERRCHCAGNVGCEAGTGVCPGECQAGWKGKNCETSTDNSSLIV